LFDLPKHLLLELFKLKLHILINVMPNRPIVLGIVGDSAAGKTTLTRGIAQVLGRKM
jgi:tRNA A37 threonylcarbamoyladenosine biosynthesis protein TsaE